MNKNAFTDTVEELKTTEFDITTSRNVPILQPTQRNAFRRKLVNSLGIVLRSMLEDDNDARLSIANVHQTQDGIAIEVENASIADLDTPTGMISFVVDISFKDLEYDALFEAEEWERKVQNELAKKAEKAKLAEAKKAQIGQHRIRNEERK